MIDVNTLAEALTHGVDRLQEGGSQKFAELSTLEAIQNDPLVASLLALPMEKLLDEGRREDRTAQSERRYFLKRTPLKNGSV